MRTFVWPRRSVRTPQKRFIIRTENKKTPWWQLFLYFYWKQMVWASIIIVWWYLFFFHNRTPMTHIVFSQETEETFMYDTLFTRIRDDLEGEGYYTYRRRERNDREDIIKHDFPLVQDIRTLSFVQGTVIIDIRYHTPDFIMKSQDSVSSVVFRNTIIPAQSGMILGTTGMYIDIALPQYAIETFSGGIFWWTPSNDITRVMKNILFLSGDMQTKYYPWREKLAITHGKDTFIIGLQVGLLKKTLEKRQHILPYLPTALPSTVDMSNHERIIIKH